MSEKVIKLGKVKKNTDQIENSDVPRSHLIVGDPPFKQVIQTCMTCGKELPNPEVRREYKPGSTYHCLCAEWTLNAEGTWLVSKIREIIMGEGNRPADKPWCEHCGSNPCDCGAILPTTPAQDNHPLHLCGNIDCQQQWGNDKIQPITGRLGDFLTRVEAGKEMPSGECPSCGFLTHLYEVRPHKILDKMQEELLGIEELLNRLPDVDGVGEVEIAIQDLSQAINFLETREPEHFTHDACGCCADPGDDTQ